MPWSLRSLAPSGWCFLPRPLLLLNPGPAPDSQGEGTSASEPGLGQRAGAQSGSVEEQEQEEPALWALQDTSCPSVSRLSVVCPDRTGSAPGRILLFQDPPGFSS